MKFCFGILILSLFTSLCAEGRFYRQYWAEFDEKISNHRDGRWRVNDPQLALHEEFGTRDEALANGLVLLNAPEFLFDLESAELYLEMWGGHPHTTNKRVMMNGKGIYAIPDYGTSENHCVYAYPSIPVAVPHLVSGLNALQFSCERGPGFWGHFIMDNVALTCFYKTDSLFKKNPILADFHASMNAPAIIENEKTKLSLVLPDDFTANIESVDFLARYTGFDDNGNTVDNDWHGYTHKRKWAHHLGTLHHAPFQLSWSTRDIPDQSAPVQFKAIVKFKDGLCYETDASTGSVLLRREESVQMFYCYDAPVPFWSRAENLNVAKISIPIDPKKIISAQLQIKIWDGGEGEVQEPFKINGHAYPITSKKAIHDVVHTVIDVDPNHLQKGDNLITLLSDTHHHGIEVLRPGPCLLVRMKR